MATGNPFGPFWDGLGVDFTRSIISHLSYIDVSEWNKQLRYFVVQITNTSNELICTTGVVYLHVNFWVGYGGYRCVIKPGHIIWELSVHVICQKARSIFIQVLFIFPVCVH